MITKKMVSKIESEESTLRLAVLIDADNAQASIIKNILAEISRFGEATVKRIYGDFTSTTNAGWKQVLQKYAIKPVQQFAYTTGKNATDCTLIIDAMDLLYTKKFDGFCLVSSDSDFTGLVMRLREEGMIVFGFGDNKTPQAFRNACNKFLLTEVLRSDILDKSAKTETKINNDSVSSNISKEVKEFPKEFILSALEQSTDDTGWAQLGTLGSYLIKLKPDFDSRVYGFKKLSDLIKSRKDIFDTEERQVLGSNNKNLYVRAK